MPWEASCIALLSVGFTAALYGFADWLLATKAGCRRLSVAREPRLKLFPCMTEGCHLYAES